MLETFYFPDNIIMTSAYIAICLLRQSSMPVKQLRIFLSHLQQKSLGEYLFNAGIYERKKNLSKVELIDMIITGKNKENTYSEDNELSMEDASNLLNYFLQ